MGLNAVLVTEYDHYDEVVIGEGKDYAATVASIFGSFGIEPNPDVKPLQGRLGKTALNDAVMAWQHCDAGAVVYWLGHGAGLGSSGRLLHSNSKREHQADGILPATVADGVFELGGNTELVVLIIEACRVESFVQSLKSNLLAIQQHMCPTLILYSPQEVTSPGVVLGVLREIIDDVFGAQAEIPLAKIWAQFELRRRYDNVAPESVHLGDATLKRSTQLPTGQTLDVHRQLKRVVDDLPLDERLHFVTKAQSAGSGELTWNFEGRDEERRTVRSWLGTEDQPICIVRGNAGQGKSAFLGDIVTRSRPELYEALVRADLMTRVDSWTELSTPNTIVSINASGLTTRSLLDRVLEGLGELPVDGADTDESVERVTLRVASMDQLVLFIVDGIDEMQDPIEGARFIGTLSARCEAKVLVACRDTPNEGRQYLSFVHPDLVQAIVDAAPTGKAQTITLRADEGAISRYIQKRLAPLSDGLVISDYPHVGATDFLHARLLVHEIIAEPEILEVGLLGDFLQLDLPELFDVMLGRLKRLNPTFIPIFQACALSQGRGLPMADNVWLDMAHAVEGTAEGPDPDALTSFLTEAEPYLRIDSEFDQTVYRPAHSLLRDHLLSKLSAVGGQAQYHVILAKLCAKEVAATDPNVYYRHAATLHARSSQRAGWWEIDSIRPSVWQKLEPSRVVEDAMSDLFGRAKMPSGVEELVLQHHINAEFGGARAVEGWAQAVRLGGYQQGLADGGPREEGVRLHWARDIVRQPLFLSLSGQRGGVTAIQHSLLGPDETGLLVGTSRGGVQLWNLASGGMVAEFEGLQRAVSCLCSVTDTAHGLVVLGADSAGVLIAWSAKTGRTLWPDPHDPSRADRGSEPQETPTLSVIAISPADEVSAVIVVSEDRIRIIDVHVGEDICAPRPSNWRLGPAVAVGGHATGTWTIAIGTAGVAGFIELKLEPGHRGRLKLSVPKFTELPAVLMSIRLMRDSPDRFRLLLSDGQVLLWTPGSRPQREFRADQGDARLGDVSVSTTGLTDVRVIGDPGLLALRVVDDERGLRNIVASHGGKPTALRVIDRPDGRAIAASGGSDRTVRIWDPYSVADRKPTDGTGAQTVLTVGVGGGKTLAVVVRNGDTVQFIDGSSGRPVKEFKSDSDVVNLSSSLDSPGRAMIAAGTVSGEVHLWKQNNLDRPDKTPFESLSLGRVIVDVDASAEFVATADSAGVVVLWRQTHKLDRIDELRFPASEVATNVKVTLPYDDLVVVVVVTTAQVHSFSFPLTTGRRRANQRGTESRPWRGGMVSCLYINGPGIGLVSGAADGQVHLWPKLWTGARGLDVDSKISPIPLNIRQPVTAIQARTVRNGGLAVVVGGAYGALARSTQTLRSAARIVEFGQPISSVSANGADVLAVACQGDGTT